MQHDHPLTLQLILERMRRMHADGEVVGVRDGARTALSYGDLAGRVDRLSRALDGLGVEAGDRVATFAWNTPEHLEVYLAVPCSGAVLHTVNVRLFADQVEYIVNHAQDRVVFVDDSLVPVLEELAPRLGSVRNYVVMGNGDAGSLPDAIAYEELLAEQSADGYDYPELDDRQAAGLCYTSGTTGNPKGVLYSHRSNILHALGQCLADSIGVRAGDRVMPVVPMFHANAWGIAFFGQASGAKLVMPGAKMDGASIYELLESEKVTFSAAVPTVWQGLLAHMREHDLKLSTVTRVLIGGSAVPESLIRAFHDDFGIEVLQGWGMTETSPIGTLSNMTPELAQLPFEEQLAYRTKQGTPPLGVELKLKDDAGQTLAHDGAAVGHLMVKGPTVAAAYFREERSIVDGEGFFDTGDVATVDDRGFMQITDRSKDVIKSGGEWISSIEIENIAVGHPKVELAAVIGAAHPKWDERPVLLLKLRDGETLDKQEHLDFLTGKIAKWWMPDDVVAVDDIPLGATGKIDKKLLRERMKDYRLPTAA